MVSSMRDTEVASDWRPTAKDRLSIYQPMRTNSVDLGPNLSMRKRTTRFSGVVTPLSPTSPSTILSPKSRADGSASSGGASGGESGGASGGAGSSGTGSGTGSGASGGASGGTVPFFPRAAPPLRLSQLDASLSSPVATSQQLMTPNTATSDYFFKPPQAPAAHELEALQTELSAARQQLQEKQAESRQLAEALAANRAALEGVRRELRAVLEECAKLKAEDAELREELRRLRDALLGITGVCGSGHPMSPQDSLKQCCDAEQVHEQLNQLQRVFTKKLEGMRQGLVGSCRREEEHEPAAQPAAEPAAAGAAAPLAYTDTMLGRGIDSGASTTSTLASTGSAGASKELAVLRSSTSPASSPAAASAGVSKTQTQAQPVPCNSHSESTASLASARRKSLGYESTTSLSAARRKSQGVGYAGRIRSFGSFSLASFAFSPENEGASHFEAPQAEALQPHARPHAEQAAAMRAQPLQQQQQQQQLPVPPAQDHHHHHHQQQQQQKEQTAQNQSEKDAQDEEAEMSDTFDTDYDLTKYGDGKFCHVSSYILSKRAAAAPMTVAQANRHSAIIGDNLLSLEFVEAEHERENAFGETGARRSPTAATAATARARAVAPQKIGRSSAVPTTSAAPSEDAPTMSCRVGRTFDSPLGGAYVRRKLSAHTPVFGRSSVSAYGSK